MDEYSIPALVFGVGVTLTGVLRTLGQAGIRVYAVCDRADIATSSRWYEAPPCGDGVQVTPATLADFLEKCGLRQAVLIPCSDDWARAVARLPRSLSDRFFYSGPNSETVELLIDKWKFANLLDQAAIPHPQTRLLETATAAEQVREECFHGGFLKPLSSVEFARRHGVKGFTVESKEEALALLGAVELPVMLQEYIPGPPTQHYFIEGFRDRTGKVCGLLARQRLRMFPLDLGNSSLMVTVSLQDVAPAASALTRLLDTLQYRGVFSAEFKRDPRDNQFKLLEINARPWWYVEFAARCGVDVCVMDYRDALGLPVAVVKGYEVGQRCTMLAIDMLAFHAQRARNGLSFSQWLGSLQGAHEALFSARDPLPAIAHWGKLLRQRMGSAPAYPTSQPRGDVPHQPAEDAHPSNKHLAQADPVRRA